MVTALAERRDDLAALIGNLNDTTRALGSQKEALAESIGRLPPFMRRANTTFVNLRSTLDEVDPLVEASKPVAKRLQPFLSQARAFAADAEPTVRDLSLTIRRQGGANDLIDLLHSFPPLAEIATVTKQRSYAPGGRAVRRRRDARRLPGVRRGAQGRRRRDRLRPPVHHRLPRLVRRLLDHRRRLRRPRRDRARHDHHVALPAPGHAGDEAVPALPGLRRGPHEGRLERALRGGAGGARLHRGATGRCPSEARARGALRCSACAPARSCSPARPTRARTGRPTRSCSTTPSASSRAATSAWAA